MLEVFILVEQKNTANKRSLLFYLSKHSPERTMGYRDELFSSVFWALSDFSPDWVIKRRFILLHSPTEIPISVDRHYVYCTERRGCYLL